MAGNYCNHLGRKCNFPKNVFSSIVFGFYVTMSETEPQKKTIEVSSGKMIVETKILKFPTISSAELSANTFTPSPKNRSKLYEVFEQIFWNRITIAVCNHIKTRQITQNIRNKREKMDFDDLLRQIIAKKTLKNSLTCDVLTDITRVNQREKKPNRLFPGLHGGEKIQKKQKIGFFAKLSARTPLETNPNIFRASRAS